MAQPIQKYRGTVFQLVEGAPLAFAVTIEAPSAATAKAALKAMQCAVKGAGRCKPRFEGEAA